MVGLQSIITYITMCNPRIRRAPLNSWYWNSVEVLVRNFTEIDAVAESAVSIWKKKLMHPWSQNNGKCTHILGMDCVNNVEIFFSLVNNLLKDILICFWKYGPLGNYCAEFALGFVCTNHLLLSKIQQHYGIV